MKKLGYIGLIVLLIAIVGCGAGSIDSDSASSVTSEKPNNNLEFPKTHSGTGENAKVAIVLDKDEDRFEYEFTNNSGKELYLMMNLFYWFWNPLQDVFPLCIKVYNAQNMVVRQYVVIEDKYYEYVLPENDPPTPTVDGDEPPEGNGYISSTIAEGQTITVKGRLIDTGITRWATRISHDLVKPVSALPTGRYTLEVFLFFAEYDPEHPTTIKDENDSIATIQMDIP